MPIFEVANESIEKSTYCIEETNHSFTHPLNVKIGHTKIWACLSTRTYLHIMYSNKYIGLRFFDLSSLEKKCEN